MQLDFNRLNHTFARKPILVGGMAMEYYGLRKSGADIDLVADERDVITLIKLFPDLVKDIYGDLGVCPFNFEIWRSIQLFKYDDLIAGAIEEGEFFVVSLEKLLVMKALVLSDQKYLQDTNLIARRISDERYKDFDAERAIVTNLLKDIKDISYIEKIGPEA